MYALPCKMSVVDYCAMRSCDRTLDAAEHDATLCGPGLSPALVGGGNYDFVIKNYTDTGIQLYYQDGELVAFVNTVLGEHHCAAGPQTFDEPFCSAPDTAPLAACSAAQ